LGADARLISAVGDDAEGHDALSEWTRLGMNTETISVLPGYPTGTVDVVADALGQPTYTIHEGVAYDFIAANPSAVALATQAGAVCFGTLAQRSAVSRASLRTLVATTAQTCLRFFDVNLRQQFYSASVIHESLTLANALKVNEDELPIVAELLGISTEGDSESTIAHIAEKYTLRLVAFTLGANGSLLWTPERISQHGGYRVDQIADTVGAGDSFTAAVLVGMSHHLDLDLIHDRAARLAAYVCTQNGGTPPIPDNLKEWIYS